MSTVFDVETKPNLEIARKLMPEFNPEDVAHANIKDPDKIKEKIEKARAKHESDWLDKSALRPEMAEVLCIGLYHRDLGIEILDQRDFKNGEEGVLDAFWERKRKHFHETGDAFLGHNIFSFDIPFLVIRSRILGVSFPPIRKGRYFDSNHFLDLRDDWLMGRNPLETKSSLGYVAKALGVGEKNGDGKNFWETYQRDHMAALNYLVNDLILTHKVAAKLGHNVGPTTASWEEWEKKYLRKETKEAF